MTPDEFHKLSIQEQADAWEKMSAAERNRMRPPSRSPSGTPLRPTPSYSPSSITSTTLSKKKLESIRSATCYGVLRAWLRLIFLGVVAVLVLSAVGCIFGAGQKLDGAFWMVVLVVCIGLFLAIAATLAVYQASLLLIDIADAQIQRAEG